MQLEAQKKIYFASDFHLGIPNAEASRKRELLICQWLDEIKADAQALYLAGDIFDVWFEYRNVVPKGFTRFLGKLAELSDRGIRIEVFTGNHDMWMFDYFEKEFNIKVHFNPIERIYNNKKFVIGHGDGLGPGDRGYKLLKKVLNNPLAKWLYKRIHPDSGVGLARYFSEKGMKHEGNFEDEFKGPEKEWLVQYCYERLRKEPVDYFVFGHRHLPIDFRLNESSVYINLGDWINYNTYAVFDGNKLELKYYKK